VNAEYLAAVREFILAEEDKRIGRWRWPENPDYVVYPTIEPAHEVAFGQDLSVMILHEPSGVLKGYCRAEDQGGSNREYQGAARAYFDAQPKSAWHSAEPGEAWVVTRGVDTYVLLVEDFSAEGRCFADASESVTIPIFDPEITTARRIYPEGDS
jgi:hypothetical protein